MKKPIVTLSLYIDAKGIYWAAVEGAFRGGVSVTGRWRQSFSEILGGSEFAGQALVINPIQASQNVNQIVSWLKSEPAKKSIREFLANLPAKPSKIHCCFSETFSIFRYFSMPKVEKMYWKKAIPIEARRYLPFSIQECVYDWQATEVTIGGRPFLGVVFGAMRREIFDAASELLAVAGYRADVVDSLPFAIARSMQSIAAALTPSADLFMETALVVYLDLEQVQMVLYAKGVPILPRSIYMSPAAQRGTLTLERRKLDLEMTLDFVRKQLGMDALSRIFLLSSAGLDDSSLKNWASGISEELGLKVEVIKPLKMSLAGVSPDGPVEASDWPDLAALGTVLAASGEATRPHGLNLARLMLEIPPKQQIIKKVWAGVAVVAGVMVALGLLRQMSARRLDSRLQIMAASMESGLPEIRDKDADAIKSLAMAKIQSVNVVRSALAPQGRFYLTLSLQAIADQIPSEVWIDGFNYSSPGIELGPGSGRKDSVILSLTGRVENKGSQTDSAAVQEFLKNLKQVSVISKKFPVTDISFQKVDPGRASRSSRGGAVAAASEASVLSFSIDFKSDAKIAN